MSKKQKSGLTLAAVLALLGALALFVGIDRSHSSARADDAVRTTSLTNASGNITATLNSTYGSDETWEISLFFTPSGGTEEPNGSASSTRTDGLTSSTTWRLEAPTSQFVSGDTIRANFRTYSSGGSVLFNFNRTLTIP